MQYRLEYIKYLIKDFLKSSTGIEKASRSRLEGPYTGKSGHEAPVPQTASENAPGASLRLADTPAIRAAEARLGHRLRIMPHPDAGESSAALRPRPTTADLTQVWEAIHEVQADIRALKAANIDAEIAKLGPRLEVFDTDGRNLTAAIETLGDREKVRAALQASHSEDGRCVIVSDAAVDRFITELAATIQTPEEVK